MSEFVYVMYRSDKGLYKIGVSKSPYERLQSIKSALGTENINMVFNMAVKNSRRIESYIHHMFSDCCVDKEWFYFSGTEFLKDVFAACFCSMERDGVHYSPTSVLAEEDKELDNIIENFFVVTVKEVNNKLGNKYTSVRLALKLKYRGCVIASAKKGRCYVTPKGIDKGLHLKGSVKDRRRFEEMFYEGVETFSCN